MNKFFEVTVEIEAGMQKNGKMKTTKEVYLVDSLSVTEAESRVVTLFEQEGTISHYKVISAKESRIMRVL